MAANPLHAVREGAARVARMATHVRLVPELIETYAQTLLVEQARCPTLDPNCHYVGHGDDTLAFIVTLDSLNFGSGYFPYLNKLPGCSGYFTIATALTEQFRRHGPWSADGLMEVTPASCADVFGQALLPPLDELMNLFARALNELGAFLIERHNGSFAQLVISAQGSATRLVKELIRMPLFNDESLYDGAAVPFYKRAQLTAADLALAFDSEGPGSFDDLGSLTMFADNLVPHVLRCDGVLTYSAPLSQAVAAGTLIPAGSAQEVEIRACAVHAVECLVDVLRRKGHERSAMQLDYLLWNRGQDHDYKAHPRHRTRTPFY